MKTQKSVPSSAMESLEGKVVLITGGTRGIGEATAGAFARGGAKVIVTSRKLQASDPRPKVKNGQIRSTHLDVRQEESVFDLFSWIGKEFGRLDVLVNNAGIGIFKPVTDLSLSEWNDVIQTNLTGAFLCSREAFKIMKKQGGGRIINIGSVADYLPLKDNAPYGSSKFGLRGLSLILNEEGISHQIRVSLLSPGAVATDIWAARAGFDSDDMLDCEDIAQTVVNIAARPLKVRIDEVRILPPKGVL